MVRAIVGANWGDEGKGKLTDMMAQESDIVIRFQGGANAGHTIINEKQTDKAKTTEEFLSRFADTWFIPIRSRKL